MADVHAPDSRQYYIPQNSPWPIRGSIAMFAIMAGAIAFLNDWAGAWSFIPGALLLAYMFFGWFSTVIDENQHGIFNMQVDRSFRMGMMWFIFSEVMFFAAFFGALFYARVLSVPWLGGQGVKVFTNFILWPQYEAAWPTNGPGHVGGLANGSFDPMAPTPIPAINTAILLTSGFTVTMAHHALRAGRRTPLKIWLALTFLLGFTFVGLQAHEYGEAYGEMGLRLTTGIYGSTFFMLTGFHGAHVTLGTLILVVMLVRIMRGHFDPDQHFGFEAAAWYWHFVDVVWLGLFIFVYVL